MTDSPATRINASLVATDRGFLPTPPWWQRTLNRFESSGARTLVARVGRGGVKSTTAVEFAIGEVLGREWRVPPGERHLFAFASIQIGEAHQRLNQVAARLDALGVRFSRVGDELRLEDLPLGFRVFSATVGAVSGFRCIGFAADEIAKWRYSDSAANPAAEVIASLRAMCVTHPDARALIVSSPWSEADYHAQLMAAGHTDNQMTAEAPTWVANPSISEEQTKRLEPDPKVWQREYAAVPQASTSPAFEDIDQCYTPGQKVREPGAGCTYGITFDLGGHRSGFGALAFHFEHRQPGDGREVMRTLVVDRVVSLVPSFLRRVTFESQVQAVVKLCREFRTKTALCDQHQFDAASEALRQHGITARRADMSVGAQARRAARYAGRFRSGAIDLLDVKELLDQHREAVSIERTNGFIIKSPGRNIRDDLLDCCLLSCDESFDKLPAGGSDIRRDAFRLINNSGGFSTKGGGYYRLSSDGTRLPVEMPKTDPRFDAFRRARWSQGVFTPADLAEFSEAELLQFAREGD